MASRREEARKAAGLSKRALAAEAGVSEAAVRKWERRGTANARASALLKAARALGVPVEEVIDEEDA